MEQLQKRHTRTIQVLTNIMKVAVLFSILGGFLLTPPSSSSNNNNNSISSSNDSSTTQSQLRGTEDPSTSTLEVLVVDDVDNELECLGWTTTGFCPNHGPPLYKLWRYWGLYELGWMNQLSCNSQVPLDAIGYCEVRMQNSGIVKQVFRQQQSCGSSANNNKDLRPEQRIPYFRCSMAQDFLHYRTSALHYQPQVPLNVVAAEASSSIGTTKKRGIVMQVYPKVLPSVYAIINLLRKDHQCRLPIELWSDDASIYNHPLLQKILVLGGIHYRTIDEPRFQGFMTKPYSVAYSSFQQVLFLDSDNFPIRDPTYLFDTKEFLEAGALFWKDYWNPQRNDFFIRQHSVLWELLGITNPDVHNEMEMESGQIVIDRSRTQKALKVLLYFAETYHQWFQPMGLVHGDKDLFRLAWHITDTPFHYIHQLPGTAGLVNHGFPHHITNYPDGFFRTCGVTMVQHDPAGQPLFLHRNAAKLTHRTDLINVWDRMELFVGTRPHIQYEIGDFFDAKRQLACCFPKATIHMYFQMSEFSTSTSTSTSQSTTTTTTTTNPGPSLADLEDVILAYASEAFDILEEKEKAKKDQQLLEKQ